MTFSGLAIAAMAADAARQIFRPVSSSVAHRPWTSPFAARSKIAGTVAVPPACRCVLFHDADRGGDPLDKRRCAAIPDRRDRRQTAGSPARPPRSSRHAPAGRRPSGHHRYRFRRAMKARLSIPCPWPSQFSPSTARLTSFSRIDIDAKRLFGRPAATFIAVEIVRYSAPAGSRPVGSRPAHLAHR